MISLGCIRENLAVQPGECLVRGALRNGERAGGYVAAGDAYVIALQKQRGDVVIVGFVEAVGFGDGARRHDADYVAIHEALGQRRDR